MFWGTRDHAHFLSGNIGKYFKGTKLLSFRHLLERRFLLGILFLMKLIRYG